MTKKRVAIFDIDGTIFRSSLLIEFTEALIQEGIFPARARVQYARAYTEWLERNGPYEEYIFAVVKAFVRHLKGVAYEDFRRVAENVVRFHRNRVYRYTRDLVRVLKKKNYYLLAISNSPLGVLKSFCVQLGFDKVYGRIYELDPRERFTGKMLYPELVADKAKLVRRAVAKGGLSLKSSVGVGDTESDISFLKLVERPVCFNPNLKLYAYAKRKRWEVIVERKDVVYTL